MAGDGWQRFVLDERGHVGGRVLPAGAACSIVDSFVPNPGCLARRSPDRLSIRPWSSESSPMPAGPLTGKTTSSARRPLRPELRARSSERRLSGRQGNRPRPHSMRLGRVAVLPRCTDVAYRAKVMRERRIKEPAPAVHLRPREGQLALTETRCRAWWARVTAPFPPTSSRMGPRETSRSASACLS